LKKVDRVVFSAFIGPVIYTFLVSEFIFLMQFLWKYIDDLVGKGLEFELILQLLVLFSFKMVPLALPLAILLASTMVMGNMGEHNELIAYKASGVSTLRVMGSLVVFVSMLSVGAYFFSNNVLPYTNMKFISLLFDIRKHKPALDIKEGIFYRGISGYTFKIGNKSPNNTTIFDIIVYDHTSAMGNDNVILAEKGEMLLSADNRYLILQLNNGRQYQETKRRSSFQNDLHEQSVVEFESYRKVFDLNDFKLSRSEQSLFKGHHEMLNARQLIAEADTVRKFIANTPEIIGQFNSGFITMSKKPTDFTNDSLPVDKIDSLDFKGILSGNLDETLLQMAKGNVETIRSYAEMMQSDEYNKYYQINRFIMEWHKKFTLSFACIILLLIGGSMGAIVRLGGFGIPVLISVVFYMIFHVLNITGEKLASEMVLPAFWGMWLPAIVLFPIALWVTYTATTDSLKLNTEALRRFIAKVPVWYNERHWNRKINTEE
jgi:lipopolysaccharide export system permease protein